MSRVYFKEIKNLAGSLLGDLALISWLTLAHKNSK